ncbi:MAG TPA: hypothetical protein PKU70_12300, partial [Vicinamibacteria bacterium]|nr:hypothetical protein [Vicinamibacteria bacterium]
EIGIRIALGALPRDVVRLVLGQGARAVGAGLVLGITGAIAQSRALEVLLFGVSGRDPMTFIAVSGLLLFVAVAASALPALRASRINPAKTLAEP